jgi:hypothetical protein
MPLVTETQTVDLAAWLTVIWDEEERLAIKAAQEIPGHNPDHPYCIDPASVLARIAADRKILAQLRLIDSGVLLVGSTQDAQRENRSGLLFAVLALASPYKGREGWQEDWGHE